MLYFVATPIGNLKGITLEALEVLSSVDFVYAENPRHSLTLLNYHEIKKTVLSYERHSEKIKSSEIVKKLKNGKMVAVVSDAGTPLISDPGSVLVQELIKHDLPFTLVGSTCAAINALVVSGLDTSSFTFVGFLPNKQKDKLQLINKFSKLECTLIFYIAVHDVMKELEFLHKNLGVRKVALVREISKKFEEVKRFELGQQIDFTQKGEFVLVVESYKKEKVCQSHIPIRIKELLKQGISKKEISKILAIEFEMSSSEIYSKIHE